MPELSIRRGERVRRSPRVSVVIPAYEPTWLDEALDSVRAQTFDDVEIIVVDDGSRDPVRPARVDDLVLIRHANAGPGGARNLGVAESSGELVAYLDSDDRWAPQKLERQVARHDAEPELVMTCTEVVVIDGDRLRPPRRTVRELGGFVGDRIPFARLFYENCITCSSVMVRRSALDRTSGMPAHRRLGEDYALWLRLALLGPVGLIDEPLLQRRQHAGSLMSQTLRDSTWLTLERQLYDEILRENPELRGQAFVRDALGRLEFQGGWSYLSRGEWASARRTLLRSIRYQPRRSKAWVDLLRAMLHVGPQRR